MSATAAPARLLIARNLRAGERTSGLFWLRAAMVGAMLLALWGGYGSRAITGGPGVVLLRTILEIDYWALLIAGICFFPVLIAEERERGTLSLLRLAGFRPLGFLLGQSLSAFLGCLLVLAVQVPFLLLAVALGGTSARQVGVALLILLLHAVTVYGVALLAGAVSHTSRSAVRLALWLVFLVTFLPRWLEGWCAAAGFSVPMNAHLAPALLATLFDDTLSASALAKGIATHAGIALAAGLGAWLLFDARDEPSRARQRARAWVKPRVRPRFPAGPQAFRTLATRLAFGPVRLRLALLTIHLVLALIAVSTAGTTSALGLLLGLQTSVALLHGAILAARCTQSVRRERVAALLMLAGGPHAWLTQQRALRMRVLGAHLLAMLLVSLLMVAQFQFFSEAIAVPLGWTLCAGFFADRFGEHCGLTFARGPLAVTVLGGGAIILVTSSLAMAFAAGTGAFTGLVFFAGGPLVLLGAIMGSATVSRLPKLYAA